MSKLSYADMKCNPQTLVWEVGCQSCLLTAAIHLAFRALSAGNRWNLK